MGAIWALGYLLVLMDTIYIYNNGVLTPHTLGYGGPIISVGVAQVGARDHPMPPGGGLLSEETAKKQQGF